MKYNLQRYIDGYELDYEIALLDAQRLCAIAEEAGKKYNVTYLPSDFKKKEGYKRSHWMWYLFPQLKGLGESSISNYYGLENIEEAKEFLNNDYLKERLLKLCRQLLYLDDDIENIFGYPDNLKLKSSMTIFSLADPNEKIFKDVLNKFYYGELDDLTLNLLK